MKRLPSGQGTNGTNVYDTDDVRVEDFVSKLYITMNTDDPLILSEIQNDVPGETEWKDTKNELLYRNSTAGSQGPENKQKLSSIKQKLRINLNAIFYTQFFRAPVHGWINNCLGNIH